MNASLFIITNLVVVIPAGIVLRLWLRNQPDPQRARRRIFGVMMWLGCLICVAAFVLSLVTKSPMWLLTSTGLMIVVSMLLARRGTAPKPGDKH
jgi:hypothetical protein